jgi:hypothetical protein
MDHTDQLNRLHDYARAIGRIKDDLETAAMEIALLAININRDIAELSAELADEAQDPPPRHCRTCGAELTMADTGFTDCHTCAWTESQKKRKEGTQP